MKSHAERRLPKLPLNGGGFVFKTLVVVNGTQLLIYSLAAGGCEQRTLGGGRSARSALAHWSSCGAALISHPHCCWRSWAEQR
jgi:hypothetical protein